MNLLTGNTEFLNTGRGDMLLGNRPTIRPGRPARKTPSSPAPGDESGDNVTDGPYPDWEKEPCTTIHLPRIGPGTRPRRSGPCGTRTGHVSGRLRQRVVRRTPCRPT